MSNRRSALERLKARLRPLPATRLLTLLTHLVRNADDRSVALLRLLRPHGLFQPYRTTGANRYPELFRLVRELIGDGADRRILSFGCSTGEEVFSLRSYFPTAAIKGIDINRRSIRLCRERLARLGGDPKLSFACASSAAGEEAGAYDAVFAMAVFRHGDLSFGPPRCDHRLRFAAFEEAVAHLARSLKPGGLLVIRHANFRFGDTKVAAGFHQVHAIAADPARPDSSPLYGPDHCRTAETRRDDGVYRKLG